MGKSASDIMNKAISYIGTKEVPAGSNKVIFNTDYYGREVSGAAYPWCCSFIWDIYRMCGASDIFNDSEKTAYCPTVEAWGKKRGLTVGKSEGKYGDIVLFDFYGKGVACHIGFIEKKNPDGTYTCLEGNTSTSSNDNGGCVMRRIRSQSQIRCIIRPKYSGSSSSTQPTSKGKGYTGTFPTLPSRGYFKKGDKGSQVRLVQQFLLWFDSKCLPKFGADADYGSETVNAVIKFQKAVGISADGQFGKATLSKAKSYKK